MSEMAKYGNYLKSGGGGIQAPYSPTYATRQNKLAMYQLWTSWELVWVTCDMTCWILWMIHIMRVTFLLTFNIHVHDRVWLWGYSSRC